MYSKRDSRDHIIKVRKPRKTNCTDISVPPKNPKIEFSLLTAISTAAEIKKGGAKSNHLFRTENIVAEMIVMRCNPIYSSN